MKKYLSKNRIFTLFSLILVVLIWGILNEIVDNQVIIPSIESTFRRLLAIISDRKFPLIILSTFWRFLLSFAISMTVAVICGILASVHDMIASFLNVVSKFFKSVPTMAIAILALIWLKTNFAPVLIGFIVIFPILYEAVLSGVKNVDKKILDMAKIYQVQRKYVIKDLYVHSIFMSISSIINSSLGLCLKVVVAGEVLGQPKFSIGSALQMEKLYLNTSGVFAWIILIIFMTAIVEALLKFFTKMLPGHGGR